MYKHSSRLFFSIVFMLILSMTLTGCSSFILQGDASPTENKVNKEERIFGIIGAMQEEVELLHKKMKVDQIVKINNLTFYKGKLAKQKVVVVRSGVGKVNAAITAQILIDKFGADALINTGVAGGLNSKLSIGDIVISTDTVQHDMDVTMFGLEPGEIPEMNKRFFEADTDLVKLAKDSAKGLSDEINVFTGRVASGDQFIANEQKMQWILDTFDAWAVEMEGAAIGQVAFVNEIPYLVIRSISDTAGDDAEDTYNEFKEKAAKNSSYLVEQMLSGYNKSNVQKN